MFRSRAHKSIVALTLCLSSWLTAPSASRAQELSGANAHAFSVIQPANNLVFGRLLEVRWNVAGTDQPPVNCKNVNLKLSTDGGMTFTETLSEKTPNDGQDLVALPSNSSSNLRWRVEATDNSVSAVNGANVSIATAKVEIYLSRHAEKDSGNDPELTPAGKRRATRLAELMKRIGITRVYSTDFRRTQQTAKPTALALNLSTILYSDEGDLATALRALPAGERVLVIGHSDSVGPIINKLGVNQTITIADNEFDKLFFVGLTDAAPQLSALRLQMAPAPTN